MLYRLIDFGNDNINMIDLSRVVYIHIAYEEKRLKLWAHPEQE